MTEKQIEHFCQELGRELHKCWKAAVHKKTREPIRLCELAERVGVTESTLRTIFRGGVKQMDLKTVLRVCAAMKASFGDIVYGIETHMGV